ncbi:Roundabout-like 1 [Stylophora pistillata]|uniref:Roundabout-like 1 n=1 Tax=Stylophora pistillata TaxID=50429 RepID=A0A2B4RKZ3_STYPI|nr:Roundabout-like 1 [Stylophora pistillata]
MPYFKAKESWTHFCILGGVIDDQTPTKNNLLDLQKAGLWRKKVVFGNNKANHEEFIVALEKACPKLKDGGGLELLYAVGGGGGQRKLETIPTGPDGYSSPYLRCTVCVGQAVTYFVGDKDCPTVECMSCGQKVNYGHLRVHKEKECKESTLMKIGAEGQTASVDTKARPSLDSTYEKRNYCTFRPVVDISSSPENNRLPIGASKTLKCTAKPRGIDSGYLDRWVDYVEWYDPQGRQVGANWPQPSNIHAHKLKLRCPLVLKNLTGDKFGRYTCQAGNGYAKHCTRKSFEIRIQNDQKPQIVQDPKSQSASIGSNATFSCTARGFPRPTIHWKKDNASYPLQSNPRASVIQDRPRNHSQLFISRVEMGDYGKYQCIANNRIGRSQSGVAILNKDVQKLEIVDGPKNQSVSIGSNATFSCTVKGFPRPTIHWIKDNASYPLESSPRTSVIQNSNEIRSLLLLTGVQKEDYGKYQCIANNSIGRSQSGVAFLNKDVQKPEIIESPKNQSASIGSNATFSCTAKGFPRPTIHWIKDNVSYPLESNPRASVTLHGPTNRSQLFITRVEMEDYGNYQCIANNSVGRSHSGGAVLSKVYPHKKVWLFICEGLRY